MLGCPGEGEVSIMAYVGSDNFGDELVDAYKKAGTTIIHQRAGVRSMLPDIAWWNVELYWDTFKVGYMRSMTSLMVISKKIEKKSAFLTFLEALGLSDSFNVLVALPQDPPLPTRLQTTVSFEWLLTRLLDPIDQSGAVQDSKRMRIESVSDLHETIMPSSPVETIMPDTPVESMSSEICPCVFWDNMDFPFYRFYEPAHIRLLLGCRGEFSIMVYVDESFGDALVLDAYKEAGVTINTSLANKYARAHSMSVDIVLWAMENPASYFEPRKLLVLSDNVKEGTDFFNALEALKDRYYDVVVLPPHVLEMVRPWPLHSLSREEAVGFSGGLASLYKQNVSSKISVFWDLQGCPNELSSILPVVRKKGYLSELCIRRYVDEDYDGGKSLDCGSLDCGSLDCGSLDCRDSSRVSCIRVLTQGDKYAKVTRMLLDILFWAMNHDDLPLSLMLISQPSKDTKCDIVLQALERRGFNVIFRPSDKVDSFESLCKTPPDNEEKVVTEASRRLALKPVILLWPVENSPPSNPMKFFYKFTSTLTEKGYLDFVTMRAYVDAGKISDELRQVYRKSAVEVRLVPEEEEFGKITHMLLDAIKWTMYDESLNFMVISKPFTDATWDSVVEVLKDKGCNVLFVTPDYMLTFGSSLWSARSLLDGSCSSSEPLKFGYSGRG